MYTAYTFSRNTYCIKLYFEFDCLDRFFAIIFAPAPMTIVTIRSLAKQRKDILQWRSKVLRGGAWFNRKARRIYIERSDSRLFRKVLSSHCLNQLFPPPSPASQTYSLRPRGHSHSLPTNKTSNFMKSFINQVSFKLQIVILILVIVVSLPSVFYNLFYLDRYTVYRA